MVKLINNRERKRKGERGVTIQIYSQPKSTSRSMTLHGMSVEEVYSYIRFSLRAKELSRTGKVDFITEVRNGNRNTLSKS